MLERLGEHRDGIRSVPWPSDMGSYGGAGIRRIRQATHSGSFYFMKQHESHKDLFLQGTEMSPPAGTHTPEPSSSALHMEHGECWVLSEAELCNHTLSNLSAPSCKAQGRDKVGPGSGEAPDRCSCNHPPDKLIWDSADWSTAQHQELSSPLPACRSLVTHGRLSFHPSS